MTFRNVSLRGPKRTFTVVSTGSFGQGRFDDQDSLVTISNRNAAIEEQPNGVQQRLHVDIAGIDQALKKLNGFLSNFDREFEYTEARRSCATLLHGGQGTGKTFLLNKIAKTGWGKVHKIGRGAKNTTIRNTFKEAKLSQPSIILIDDLEVIVSKEDSVSQDNADALGEELDNLIEMHPSSSLPRVLVAAATREASSIPNSLKKIMRFETSIVLPIPDASARKKILKSLNPRLHPDAMNAVLDKFGDRTHAYTPEDLVKLLNAAYYIAEEKKLADETSADEPRYLIEEDIENAMIVVRPTAMHDITLQPPSVRWNQIGGQDSVKKALRHAVETPLLVGHSNLIQPTYTDFSSILH
jgi:AAA family ATPase